MFFTDTSNCDVIGQTIFVRSVIAIPRDYVKSGVVHFRLEETIHEFTNHSEAKIAVIFVLKSSHRILEVFRIRETVSAYGSCFRKLEMSFVDLTSISTRCFALVDELHRILDTSGDDSNLVLNDL